MKNGEVEQRIRGLGKAKGVFPVEDGYLFTTVANAGNGSVEMRDAQGASYGKWNCRICRGSAMWSRKATAFI